MVNIWCGDFSFFPHCGSQWMVIWICFGEYERNATKIESNKTLMTISRKLNMIKKTSFVSHLARFFCPTTLHQTTREEKKMFLNILLFSFRHHSKCQIYDVVIGSGIASSHPYPILASHHHSSESRYSLVFSRLIKCYLLPLQFIGSYWNRRKQSRNEEK